MKAAIRAYENRDFPGSLRLLQSSAEGGETIERLLRVKWWDLELSDLSGLPFRDVERCLDRIEEIKAEKPAIAGAR